jgi:hypothetical protein
MADENLAAVIIISTTTAEGPRSERPGNETFLAPWVTPFLSIGYYQSTELE